MNSTKQKAFTLVELIVVVTILAILATIGFVSYSSYLTGVRDTNRISQLSSISDGLNLYSTKNSLPLPEDSVEVQTNTQIIAYQGYAGSNTLETIDFTKGGIDPKDDSYFSYYLTKDRKHFQLMAFLEEADSLAFVPSPGMGGLGSGITHAEDYSDRYPTVTGRKLGILTDDVNTPIQEISTLDGVLNIEDDTTGYIAHMTSDESITEGLLSINQKASCKRIKQMKGGSQDGVYKINPEGNNELEVYCDMTTDGGGWTALVRINTSLNPSTYWNINIGTNIGKHYNYLNLSPKFDVKEIYVNNTVGFNGGEYLFEKDGTSLYARRGSLKDVELTSTWAGISDGTLGDWLMGTSYSINGITYIGHSNPDFSTQDFPFYDNLSPLTPVSSRLGLSDNGWGGRGYVVNEDAYIFVR